MGAGIEDRLNKIDVSVVMPAYNEELNVSDAVSSVIRAFDELGIPGELIVVDDGSTDRTNEIVSQFRDVDQESSLFHMNQIKASVGHSGQVWIGRPEPQ